MPIERRRVIYSGRVQGVGFRFLSQKLAQGFAVSGSVRNLADGRVELIVQGEGEVISAYLAAVGRELGDKIHSSHVEAESVADPLEREFTIRY